MPGPRGTLVRYSTRLARGMIALALLVGIIQSASDAAAQDRNIIIFNAGYDVPMLKQTAVRHQITLPRLRSHCLMVQYFEYVRSKSENGSTLDFSFFALNSSS